MNVVKIQQELIKDVLSNKSANWFIQRTDTEVILFTKFQIYLFDHKDFLLKYSKLVDAGVKELTTAKNILNSADNAKPAHKTGVIREIGTSKCLELKVEGSDELVYLDEKLLKHYDKKSEFEATDHKSPVFIYENDILVGVVLPVKVG